MVKAGGAIDGETPAERLHDVRILGKKLRYLLEFFRSLYAEEEIDIAIKELKRLQDNLGDFNDYEVQGAAMGRFAEELASEMMKALELYREMDIVLMDSAGGSQFNLEQINELRGLFYAAKLHECFLCVQAGATLEDLRSVVSNFACLRPSSLLVTKLDETRQYGSLLSLAIESQLPLSYLTNGQNVPDDIRTAAPEMVAKLILEGRSERG